MELADQLNCPVCLDLFTNAYETVCCGQPICYDCLVGSINNSRGCPLCCKNININECYPNRTIQRMVDQLQIPCTFPYCTLQVPRATLQEHMKISHNKRICFIHNEEETVYCAQDEKYICGYCAIIGKHQHHLRHPLFLEKAIYNASAINVQQSSLPITKLSLSYIIANMMNDLRILDSIEDLEKLNDKKEIEITNLNENEQHWKQIVLAAYLCVNANIDVNVDNIINVLIASGSPLSDRPFATLVEECAGSLKSIFAKKSDVKKQNEEEYKKLKEEYKTNNFNFEGIQIKTVPLSKYVYPNKKNTVFVLLEIRSGKKETTPERPPFDLSLVLDISGSMSGSKLNNSKQAISNVIENILPHDRVHLTLYDDRASVLFLNGTASEREKLLSQVKNIRAGGCTNLEMGLKIGDGVFSKESHDVKKMFLFSDGVANSGITSKDGIFNIVDGIYEGGVGVSSFGIGSDFDEAMMKGIGEHGHGNFFFIDKSESIPSLVEKAFLGVTRILASNVTLKVTGAPGVTVRKLNSTENISNGIPLGDIRESDLKQILLEVEVEPNSTYSDLNLLSYELNYKRVDLTFIPEGPQTGNLSMKISENFEDFFDFSDEVLVYLKINECAEIDKKIVEALDRRDMARAFYLKAEAVEILSEIAEKDKLGFAKVLLMKAKERLEELRELKDKPHSSNYAMVKKAVFKEAEEEEDEDMGFGLFD